MPREVPLLAIVGGTVHTISHGIKEGHSLLVRDGIIEAVVPDGPLPQEYALMDASGCFVLPGLIDPRTSVGLYGDGGGFQNADNEELTGPDTAWVRAIDALNPRDVAFRDARRAGVTTLLVGPGTTNVAGGLSAVVKTAGETVQEMVVREPAGLQMSLGHPPLVAYREKNKVWTRMGVVALLRERLAAARVLMAKEDEASDGDLPVAEGRFRIEPYIGLLARRYPARVRVATSYDAWTALRLADEFGFDLVLEEVTEGHEAGLPEELARRGIRCVVGPMMKAAKTPETAGRTFHTAGALHEAGVTLAFCSGHPSRAIPFLASEAALAVRAGLEESVALRALTLNAAACLGLEGQLGSLEPGKEADLTIFDGHPLLPTSNVTHTLIAGRVVHEA